MAPPNRDRRVALIDAVRGFALLGIVVVNSTVFSNSDDLAVGALGTLDQAVRWGVSVLFQSKFYLLFAFLFGYSFTIQLDRAEGRGVGFTPRFGRRLAGLALLGLAHAVLLFSGDILVAYALLGAVLLAVRGLSPRAATTTAVALLGIVCVGFLAMAARLSGMPAAGAAADIGGEDATGAGAVIADRVASLPGTAEFVLVYQAPSALAMFLLGLACGKSRVLHAPERFGRLGRRAAVAGLAVGGPVALLYAHGDITGGERPAYAHLTLAADAVGGPLLAAAYLAGIVALLRRRRGRILERMLAPAGRMALSNYLGQSLLLGLVFTAFGLGLAGSLGPAATLAVAIAVFALQCALSAVWLRRHRYGPAEWLLRYLTELRRPAWAAARPDLTRAG